MSYKVNGIEISIEAINANAKNNNDWSMVLNGIKYLESQKVNGAFSVNLINGWTVAL